MNILITNDDGWGTPGIVTLTRLMASLSKDAQVYVVAPNGPRSAFSSKVSINSVLEMEEVAAESLKKDYELPENVHVYTTDGTPCDCVKLGINVVLKGQTIDLLVSGINHGSNSSVNLVYSGTMGAALVGAENGIPSIGYSIDAHEMDTDLSHFAALIQDITRHLIDEKMPVGVCYNVNAPVGPIQGLRWTRQASGFWQKEVEVEVDEQGKKHYHMVGEFVNREPEAGDTDLWAVSHGFVSIQPVTVDMTAYGEL